MRNIIHKLLNYTHTHRHVFTVLATIALAVMGILEIFECAADILRPVVYLWRASLTTIVLGLLYGNQLLGYNIPRDNSISIELSGVKLEEVVPTVPAKSSAKHKMFPDDL